MKYRVLFGLSQCVTQFASNSKHRAFVVLLTKINHISIAVQAKPYNNSSIGGQ